ncbi:MAG: gamma-glutamyltransferase [Corallococcus sp.]|nr:gamma-glutamyltransferase [Corallococcus sp.]
MKQSRRIKLLSFVLAAILTVTLLAACAPEEFDPTDLSVRDYVGKNGVVASANPYASKAGLDILKAGGNAFDAAVAVAFAIGVAEPDANGLGGGGVMMSYNADTQKSVYYNFREFASFSYDGQKSGEGTYIAVPTEVAGLLTILEEQGTMTRQQVMKPAIDLAESGVIVTPELAKNISSYAYKLYGCGDTGVEDAFLIDGLDPIAEGSTLVQPQLANTLKLISEKGKEGFYKGELAQKIVARIQELNGYVTMSDMEYAMNNYPKKGDALTGEYGGYSILTANSPSTGGTMLIEMLNMLEHYKTTGLISQLNHNSAEYVNLIATVQQLSYGDKEKYMADSAFVDVPYKGLTSKEYAAERLQKYTAGKAYLGTASNADEQPYGNPIPYNGAEVAEYGMSVQDSHFSTTSFSVADKHGNLVTFTQTVNNFFGSGKVAEGTGFFLNDQIRDFSYTEGSINSVEAGKQPASYMMPTVLLKDGKPFATLGTPGGSRIPAAMLQVILNMLEFGMDIQSAINAPRFYCFTTNESNRNDTAKELVIEKSLESLSQTLQSFGYDITVQGYEPIDSYLGGVQGIQLTNKGELHGAADPRRDGKAFGY